MKAKKRIRQQESRGERERRRERGEALCGCRLLLVASFPIVVVDDLSSSTMLLLTRTPGDPERSSRSTERCSSRRRRSASGSHASTFPSGTASSGSCCRSHPTCTTHVLDKSDLLPLNLEDCRALHASMSRIDDACVNCDVHLSSKNMHVLSCSMYCRSVILCDGFLPCIVLHKPDCHVMHNTQHRVII